MIKPFLALVVFLQCSISIASADGFRVCGAGAGNVLDRVDFEVGLTNSEDRIAAVLLDRDGDTKSGAGRFCGGVLLDESWALTARHCVEGKLWDSFFVHFPSVDEAGLVSRPANVALCPEEILPFPKNDIALVHVSRPFPPMRTRTRLLHTPEHVPFAVSVASWPIAESLPSRELKLSGATVLNESSLPMLMGQMEHQTKRVPCGGESGSALVDPGGSGVLGVLTAISGSNGGRPNCDDTNTKIFVTPVEPWIDWISQTISSCEAAPDTCFSPE